MKFNLYFLAILPPQEIADQITEWKKEIAKRFDASHALKSPPHITLQMPFKWLTGREEELSQKLQSFVESISPFLVVLEGFGSFPPGVIYVRIQNPEALISCYKSLREYLALELGFTSDQLTRRFHPHMTLATRDLKKNVFPVAWSDFKQRKYNADFISDQLTLLKHNGHHWKVFRNFSRKNQ